MSDIKLLPCPFCGSNKTHIRNAGYVQCLNCTTCGPSDTGDKTGIELWNGALRQHPAATLPDVDDDDLTVAYMAGRHDGRKEASQPAEQQQPAAKSVAWVAEVFPDWTTLRIAATGDVFAFNRETGRAYKIPHPDCPFVTFPASPTDQQLGGSDDDR